MTSPEKTAAFLSRIEIALFIGCSFFLIPFSCWPGLVDPGLSLRYCLLAGFVAVWAILRFFRASAFRPERISAIPRTFIVFYGGYCIVSLFSILPAVNKSEAVFDGAKVFLFCTYGWFAATMIRQTIVDIRIIAHAVTLSSLIIATLGIVEYWGVFSIIDNNKVAPGVTMLNRNLLASYLFLCLGFVLFVIVNGRRRTWRFFGVLAYTAILYVLFATQSRAVWLGCLVGGVCTIITVAVVRRRLLAEYLRSNKKNIFICAILLGITVIAASFLKPAKAEQASSLTQRVATIADPKFESNNQRILLWRKTIRMSMEHPWLGVGAGNWKIALPRYGVGDLDSPDMNFIETRPYNDFLWVLAETGIFGLICYAGLFFMSAFFCVAALRKSHDRTTVVCAGAMLFSLIGFTIISLFDFPKERMEHLVLLGCIFGICAALKAGSASSAGNIPPGTMVQRSIYTGALLTCAIMCLLIGIVRFRGDIHAAAMRDHWKNQEWQRAITEADLAFSRLYTMDPTSTPLHWYRGVANFNLGNIDQAILDYSRAYACHPWHVQVLNDLGTCHNLAGHQKQAIAWYTEALALSPLLETVLINLSAVYYNSGQYDQAYTTISRCKTPYYDSRFESFFHTISLKTTTKGAP